MRNYKKTDLGKKLKVEMEEGVRRQSFGYNGCHKPLNHANQRGSTLKNLIQPNLKIIQLQTFYMRN